MGDRHDGRDGEGDDARPRRRVLHGRRRGPRLRPERARLLAERLPRLEIALPPDGSLDPRALFADAPRTLWLEIGFGGGEHLAALALARPQTGFIGCEPFINGVARLLTLIERDGLSNIRLFTDDARLLLAALPDRCLDGIAVMFPDPWPKLRHHKRRIVNPDTVAAMARLLRAGGELRLATDHPGYARAMLQLVGARAEFAWTARRPADWRSRPADWPATRYEAKALAAGARPIYLSYRRRETPEAAGAREIRLPTAVKDAI